MGEYLAGKDVRVDVLHVNDSGSNNASEWLFLDKIQPRTAVISVGVDTPGLPSLEALTRLIDVGVIRIYQTGTGKTPGEIPPGVSRRRKIEDKDIVVVSDGNSFYVADDRYEADP